MKTTYPKQVVCILALALLACAARAQTGWTNLYTMAGAVSASANAIAVDGSGNVFVTGTSYDGTNYLIATIKYSNAGVPLWTNLYLDPTFDGASGSAIAVDTSGNVFVTTGSPATIKYSNDGVPLWTNLWAITAFSDTICSAIAVDGSGNAFVMGEAYDGANFLLGIAKYSNDGVPLWTNIFFEDYVPSEITPGLIVDGSGNAFVKAEWLGGIDGSGHNEYGTIKFSNAGVPLWTNLWDWGGPVGWPAAIAADGSGNLVLAAAYPPGIIDVSKFSNAGVWLWDYDDSIGGGTDGQIALVFDSSNNVFVTEQDSAPGDPYFGWVTFKVSNAGVTGWINVFTMAGGAFTSAIAVDGSGNAFVTGAAYDASTNEYCATIKYSNAGVPLWTNLYTMAGGASASAIAVDGSGNAFVTGIASDGTNNHYLTIKYPAAFVPPLAYLQGQWLNQQLVLSWTNAGFSLQSAPALTGTFTNIPGATSPYTNPVTGPQQFFRLMQ